VIRGVIFDFDDTLADTSGVHERVWPSVVAVVARHVPGLDEQQFLERYDGVMDAHYERLLHGKVDFEGFRRERLAEALEPWAPVSDELMREYYAVKVRVIDELRPYADAIPTLRSLRAAGIRVAILTNGPSELQRRKLAVTGIDREVDVIGISGEIGAHKPSSSAFAAVLELLGAEAAEAAMVGDSLVNDVGGALAHGFARVVWVARSEGSLPEGALEARCIAEVPHLIGIPA
jgi:putative hydrolase of the HAD superfamily